MGINPDSKNSRRRNHTYFGNTTRTPPNARFLDKNEMNKENFIDQNRYDPTKAQWDEKQREIMFPDKIGSLIDSTKKQTRDKQQKRENKERLEEFK